MLNSFRKILFVVSLGVFFVLPTSVFAGRAEGGQIDNFDVQPRTVQGGQAAQFIFKVTIFSQEIRDYCGPIENNLRWVISRKIGDGPLGAFQSGQVLFSSFINGISRDLSFTKPLFSVPTGTGWTFSAKIYCGVAIPATIAQSSPVNVTVSGGTTGGNAKLIYGCVANDGKYACSPSDVSTCADAPACSSKACVQVDKARCGQLASGPGDGTPGKDQGFSFSIPNPLKGGAEDLGGLVKIIAQWLFNLAIPIAVIMIIYAGVLFLTAQGNPTTITKAKDVLKWAVVGLAIILIGSGFVTLIQSILDLGAPPSSGVQTGPLPVSGGVPCRGGADCPMGFSCDQTSAAQQVINGQTFGTCFASARGAVGSSCSRDRDCFEGSKCNTDGRICQRPSGNLQGEPCQGGRNCAEGLGCDASGENVQVIGGQNRGTCR